MPIDQLVPPSGAPPRLTDEMRRLVCSFRALTAALASVLLASRQEHLSLVAILVLAGYMAWSAWLLGSERRASALWHYWIDVAWSCTMLQLVNIGTGLLVLTLVNPIVVASIGHGVGSGLLLALAAASGVAIDSGNYLSQDLWRNTNRRLPAMLALALMPIAAVLVRPIGLLRQRSALLGDLEQRLDPRRGLEPVCTEIVEQLRDGTTADVVGVVLPSRQGAPALLASRDEGSYRADEAVHTALEALLAEMPEGVVSVNHRSAGRGFQWLRKRRGEPVAQAGALARTLGVGGLHVVPLTRYGRRHGHFVVGYRDGPADPQDARALAAAAPDLLRIMEQAALVDRLQEESAAHERARIGRDLHDSAIQPYLGIKYAVEAVAMRVAPSNPARGDLQALAELVNGEVAALRELISQIRTGGGQGDDALVPAVRRQVRRFTLLFGIDVDIDSPEALTTSRATASALFHMVNEALNNIRKHTAARRVWIALSVANARFRLVVRDDGGTVLGHPVDPFVPASLNERARERGGSLGLSLHDGLNTEMVIEIPL